MEDDKQGFSYGLKCSGSCPQVKDLIQFEDDLVGIVKELKFHKVKNEFQFQKMLCKDMNKVQTSKKILTPADNACNMYGGNKSNYENILGNAITTPYKKENKNIGTKINKEGIKFAKQAAILDKTEMNGAGYLLFFVLLF